MNPKEKAKELVNKYWKYSTYAITDSAQKCALIAVDEILNWCIESHEKYWQEVKQEILKL